MISSSRVRRNFIKRRIICRLSWSRVRLRIVYRTRAISWGVVSWRVVSWWRVIYRSIGRNSIAWRWIVHGFVVSFFIFIGRIGITTYYHESNQQANCGSDKRHLNKILGIY
jgi:hypothetical protein